MRRLIYVFFFFSGFSGLIYEVLWTRLFVLVMGGTVYSFTMVLVAFMSGLALGGYLGGRYADRMRQNPVFVYGILEGLIGLYCLFIPVLIKCLNPIFNFLYPFLSGHNSVSILVRFVFSGLLLVIPCMLMGATLPILVRYNSLGLENFGRTTAILYGINSLGAVFGSFVSGMILLPALGQMGTLYFSAVFNFLILFSILLFKRFQCLEPVERSEGVSSGYSGERNWKSVLVLLGYGLSGALAMIYQVCWTRALILSLGTSLYVLSLILTAYIAGLSLGSMLASFYVDRLKRFMLWIGVFEAGIGISAWAVVPVFGNLPVWTALVIHPRNYYSWLGIEFLMGFGLIFIPTFLMGALMPIVVRAFRGLRGGVGEAVGQVYATNTIGAILGSFVCGFFLISLVGLKNSLSIASALSLIIGAGFILAERIPGIARAFISVSLMALIFIFGYFQPGWSPYILNSGSYIYYQEYFSKSGGDRKRLIDNLKNTNKVLFHKEGVEATVSVLESPEKTIALRINGKTDASTSVDMTTQVFTGHLPLLFHPEPKKVALIGLASGVTLGSVLTHPVEEVVCIEISPEVVLASRYFNTVNRRPLEDKRTRLIINDARYHLAHTDERYDVLISEPSNPWISGMGLLFTKEFFASAKQRLNPGGIMLIWIGVYDLDLLSVQMIVRSFIDVFPETVMWEAIPGGDYLILGFNDKMPLDYSILKAKMHNPLIKNDLSRVNLDTPEKFIARFILGTSELKEFADEVDLHTDDRRQLEFRVPKVKYKQSEEFLLMIMKSFFQFRKSPEIYLSFSNPEDELDRELIDRFHNARTWLMQGYISMLEKGQKEFIIDKLLKAYEIDPNDRWLKDNLHFAYYYQGQYFLNKGKLKNAVENFTNAWEFDPRGSEIPSLASFYYFITRDYASSEKWSKRAIEKNPLDPFAWLIRGKLEMLEGKPEVAIGSFKKAFQNSARVDRLKENSQIARTILKIMGVDFRAEVFYQMAEAYFQLGDKNQALSYYEQALTIAPDFGSALIGSARIFMDNNQNELAIQRLSRATSLNKRDALAHFFLGKALSKIPSQRQSAISELKTFLELSPGESVLRNEAVQILSGLGAGQ